MGGTRVITHHDDQQWNPEEPETTLVERYHVRRDDLVVPLADTILTLLEPAGSVIDLSHHDRRADVIEVRVSHPDSRS